MNEITIFPGHETVVESDAGKGNRGVVFEDDGETGYFYARDFEVEDQLFVDALHIYSVKQLKDADLPTKLHVLWSKDYTKAALILNQSPHAMFDFINKCGYSKDQFPDPDPKTEWKHEAWDDSLSVSAFFDVVFLADLRSYDFGAYFRFGVVKGVRCGRSF